MNTLRVTDTEGHTVHIGPHDIFRRDLCPVHKDTLEADVRIEGVVVSGSIAVLMWRAGTSLGAVVYDRDDRVRWVA